MYAAYFGLTEPPFCIAPDPRYLYMSPRHRDALAHLLYGVEQGGGFVQLTGEVGTGKTTLCRCLLSRLPDEVDAALIINPRINELELMQTLCDELGIAYPLTGSIKLLLDRLNAHLLAVHGAGRRTVLIVDESQNLSFDVLEQVRLLTNLETTRQKLLQIILIGQPELMQVLAQPELRQLAQRITARYHLLPLSKSETGEYIRLRLSVAGGRQPLFTAGAARRVFRLSQGVPRLINVICDRALLGAYAGEQRDVGTAIVNRAVAEVLGSKAAPPRRYWRLALPGAGLALLVLGAGWWAGSALRSPPTGAVATRAAAPPPATPVPGTTPQYAGGFKPDLHYRLTIPAPGAAASEPTGGATASGR